MIFLKALWHSAQVIGAGLYWLLSVIFVWAGLAQLGTAPAWGWACLSVVAVVAALRLWLLPKFMSTAAGYVVASGFYLAFLLAAAGIAGTLPPTYDNMPACVTSDGKPCAASTLSH